MAGAGVRLFTAGSVLTANQVNTYLMDQTIMRFADSAARDASFGGLGEPALSEGMVCYLDSDNKIYVNTTGTAGGWTVIGEIPDLTISTKSTNYTIGLNDKNTLIETNVASANTITVPTNATVAFPIGSQISIVQFGAGKTQIVAATPATTTVRATPGAYLRTQYSSATLIKRGTDDWYLIGDLSST